MTQSTNYQDPRPHTQTHQRNTALSCVCVCVCVCVCRHIAASSEVNAGTRRLQLRGVGATTHSPCFVRESSAA